MPNFDHIENWLRDRSADLSELDEGQRDDLRWAELIMDAPLEVKQVDSVAAWSRVEALIDRSDVRVRRIAGLGQILGYAAAIALLVGVGLALTPKALYSELTTEGQMAEMTLSDASMVKLGNDSYAKFPSDFHSFGERRVQLEGHGSFDVTSEPRQFVVETPLCEMVVLGTSFTCYGGPDSANISVQEGQVAFRVKDDPENVIYLQAGDSAYYTRGAGMVLALPDVDTVETVVERPVILPPDEVVEVQDVIEPEGPVPPRMITVDLKELYDMLAEKYPGQIVKLRGKFRARKGIVEIEDLDQYATLREAYPMLNRYIDFLGRQDDFGVFKVQEIKPKK